jgi:hypothetical protein
LALWISAVLTDAPPTLSEKRPGRRSAATLLTKDEARRIAVNIAKFAPDPPAGFNIAAHENNYLSQKNKISSGARVKGLQRAAPILDAKTKTEHDGESGSGERNEAECLKGRQWWMY